MKSNVAFNPALTLTAQKFMQDASGFVGRRLFPLFFTALQAANYYVFDRENMLNVPTNIRRHPAAPYARHVMQLSGDSYSCQNYGVEEPVDDEERAKYGNAVDADNAAVRRGVNTILVNHEVRVRTAVINSGSVSTSSPGTRWDQEGSTPIQDVRAMREAIHTNCGMEATTLCMNRAVFNVLCDHSQIVDRIKYSERGVITEQILAAVFGVSEVLVAGGMTNTAAEGLMLNPGSIWDDTVILAHVEKTQDLSAPNFGRTFAWRQFTGPDGLQTFTYRQDEIDSDVQRVRQHCDEKLVGPECGYLLSDVLS